MKERMSSIGLWWASNSTRERRLLTCGVFFVVVSVIYWAGIQPLNDRSEKAQIKITNERQLYDWVKNKADQIVSLRGNSGTPISGKPLNQVISESSQRFNLELIRMQPREEMLQVWVKPVAFEQFIAWLDFLKTKQDINVEFLDISKTDSKGIINVKRLQLKRGG